MADPFSPVAILGPGLIGGSLGLALHQRYPDAEIRVWARSARSFTAIRALGFAHAVSTDLESVVRSARCIVLCTPVETMAGLSAQMSTWLAPDAVVTDAGSVKGDVTAACEEALGARFVGAHPIAGSDRSGIEAASVDLYEGATCVLTPSASTSQEALSLVRSLWQAVGCRILEIPPLAHDAALARTSHLPHCVAAALATAVAQSDPDWPQLVGGGYRDTTRIALGSPDLWTGILLANRKELSTSVAEFVEILQNFRIALEAGDAEAIRAFLSAGHAARNQSNAF